METGRWHGVGGILLLSEYPTPVGIAGLVLIVVGSYWILGAEKMVFSGGFFFVRIILYRIGALILTALEAVLIKKVMQLSSVELSFLSWCWSGALFSLIGGLILHERYFFPILFTSWRNRFFLLFLALCFGAMQYSSNLVFERLPVGLSLALFQLSAVINLYLGWRLFREQGMRKKIFGTAMTIGGAVLIILSR